VFEVIETWQVVQRKWLYLLSIFSSEDIKSALPEENKSFNKIDTAYRKIMADVQKNPNILACCVKNESEKRLEELTEFSHKLDKCEKSLT